VRTVLQVTLKAKLSVLLQFADALSSISIKVDLIASQWDGQNNRGNAINAV